VPPLKKDRRVTHNYDFFASIPPQDITNDHVKLREWHTKEAEEALLEAQKEMRAKHPAVGLTTHRFLSRCLYHEVQADIHYRLANGLAIDPNLSKIWRHPS
jgi:hypothetical protein